MVGDSGFFVQQASARKTVQSYVHDIDADDCNNPLPCTTYDNALFDIDDADSNSPVACITYANDIFDINAVDSDSPLACTSNDSDIFGYWRRVEVSPNATTPHSSCLCPLGLQNRRCQCEVRRVYYIQIESSGVIST